MKASFIDAQVTQHRQRTCPFNTTNWFSQPSRHQFENISVSKRNSLTLRPLHSPPQTPTGSLPVPMGREACPAPRVTGIAGRVVVTGPASCTQREVAGVTQVGSVSARLPSLCLEAALLSDGPRLPVRPPARDPCLSPPFGPSCRIPHQNECLRPQWPPRHFLPLSRKPEGPEPVGAPSPPWYPTVQPPWRLSSCSSAPRAIPASGEGLPGGF